MQNTYNASSYNASFINQTLKKSLKALLAHMNIEQFLSSYFTPDQRKMKIETTKLKNATLYDLRSSDSFLLKDLISNVKTACTTNNCLTDLLLALIIKDLSFARDSNGKILTNDSAYTQEMLKTKLIYSLSDKNISDLFLRQDHPSLLYFNTLILLAELNKLDFSDNKNKNNSLNINNALNNIINNARTNKKTLEEFLFDLEEYRSNNKLTDNQKADGSFTCANNFFNQKRNVIEKVVFANLQTKYKKFNNENNKRTNEEIKNSDSFNLDSHSTIKKFKSMNEEIL